MRIRPRLGDVLWSAGGIFLLIVSLSAIDDRVREQVSMHVTDHPTAEIRDAGQEAESFASVVATAVRDQSVDHAPLTTFAAAGTILLVFMLRT